MVLDTDTYNEIDDQFALVYSLLSPNLTVEAIYAAPFSDERFISPADGMEKSYEEILRLLDRLGRPHQGFALKGADRYLPDYAHPVRSAAVDDLIARARRPRREPLYVVAIGAITNVASAILLAPDIMERIVVVWLGGNPEEWPTAKEFNLQQDMPSSKLMFECGAPLVHVPCKNVAEHLCTTLPEMERYVKGRGAIGDYLYTIYLEHFTDHYARSKVLWDVTTIAYLNNPAWTPSEIRPAPILTDDMTWAPAPAGRHVYRAVTDIKRDPIFADFFRKLDQASK
jgi:inosine-uridine nucleoside N-ribohydrolase